MLMVAIGDNKIPQVASTKFLGVILDEKLTWEQHVSHALEKLQSNKHLLSLSKNLLPMHCLKLIYYSHIYCHLSYGLGAWGSMIRKGNMNELFRIQKQFLHYMCNLGQNDLLEKEYPKRGIIQFPDMITIELHKLSHKITINQVPKPLQTIMKKEVEKSHTNITLGTKNTKYAISQLNNIQSELHM